MPTARDIIDGARAAALWLLVGLVFLGPAGLGGSAGFAATASACGSSCPCDAAPEEHADSHSSDHGGERDEHAACERSGADGDTCAEHGDDEPCRDQCPEDCPNCGCCLGVAMAVLTLPATSSSTACTRAPTLTSGHALTNGAHTDIFRPPRARS